MNVASVSSTTPDDTAANNTATVETTLNRDADVAISQGVSPASVLVGQPTTFTVVVTNHGPARATGLVVQDLLPAGLSFVSATASQGSYADATGRVDDRDAAERAIGDADARGDRDRGRRDHQPRAGRRAGPARSGAEQQRGGGDRERRRQRRRRRDHGRRQAGAVGGRNRDVHRDGGEHGARAPRPGWSSPMRCPRA